MAKERMTSDESQVAQVWKGQDTEPSTAEICGNIQRLPSQKSLGRKGQTMPTFRGQEGKYKTKHVVYIYIRTGFVSPGTLIYERFDQLN